MMICRHTFYRTWRERIKWI